MEFPAWDPVLFDIPGLPIDIRWYGLMYVVGFVVGQSILVRLARAGFWPVAPQQAPDLIVWLVLGVMLGGRLGYALFYEQGLLVPTQFLMVHKGGLSFHGGLIGVVVALVLFARKRRIPWLRVGDACALAVTPGILAVRFANWINGELYGRVCDASTFLATRFPTDPVAQAAMRIPGDCSMRDRELCIQYAFRHRSWEDVKAQLSDSVSGAPFDWEGVRPYLDWEAVQQHVPYRHPSQLYEGIGEGLVLGCVLIAVYFVMRGRPVRRGLFGGLFLLGYASVRIAIEFVRQPDSQFGPGGQVWLGMTMGQTLSALMVLGGLAMLMCSRQHDVAAPPPPPGSAGAEVPA